MSEYQTADAPAEESRNAPPPTSTFRAPIPDMGSFDLDPSIALLLVASFVEMVAAAKNCDEKGVDCEKYNAFAVALGTISFVFVLVFLILNKFVPSVATMISPGVSIFLMLWWLVGASVVTFKKPFKNTAGNGYFSSWVAFASSVIFAYSSLPQLREIAEKINAQSAAGGLARKLATIILVASLVELIAASVQLDDFPDTDKKQTRFAVSVGVISTVVCFLFLAIPILGNYFQFASLFLAVWWIVAVGVLTFDAPFTSSGNGYFSTWIACLASIYLVYAIFLASGPNV